MKTHANARTLPATLAELLDIKGITSSKVNAICKAFQINTLPEFTTAVEMEQLDSFPELTGDDKKNIKRALKLYKNEESRIQLAEAILQGKEVLHCILQFPEVQKAAVAGSLRRGKDTIGDIDIVVQLDSTDRRKFLYKIARMPLTDNIFAAGKKRIGVVLHNQLSVYFYLTDAKHYGASLLYYTGSKNYNALMKNMATTMGYRLDANGLYDVKNHQYIATEKEEEIFQHMLLDYIPPELREEQGVITAAEQHAIPSLVTFDQLKGDMQIHSNWSDGDESIAHIARYMFSIFPHYQYIVITDHASLEGTDHVLQPADITRQAAEIAKINNEMGYDYVKRGVEVDILDDGQLSLPNELLKQFDWVIAAVHSHFTHDNTARLIKACENPYVHCIGHPSGRLIGSRDPYPVDWDKLFSKAAATGTAMEINARPNRLDLDDTLVKKAIAKGVKLIIDTDAHQLNQFDCMQLGIWVARRGGCGKADILNAHSWKEIEKFKKNKLSASGIN
ncbi:MAG: DNA polymerase III [Chitinophaga sp.]|uniref:DNA polymerase III n=1 Tax=Chitinophaga sp. TaxID=1869181 RepID=UPI001B1BA93F|nr:DNA polymerase III [Chitinophaga sp.]MBO9729690.1 DNA polymerase III [Chitinophaga sp.]